MADKLRFHPELLGNLTLYKKIADFEEGDVTALADYLIKYGSEKEREPKAMAHYASRVERLRNDNFVNQYLRLHLGHLSQPMKLSGVEENERLAAIAKDATGFGWSHNQAFRERLKLFIRDGRVATLIDSTANTADSEQAAKVNKEQSYQIIYCAKDILDWSYFEEGPRRGELQSVTFPFRPVVIGTDVYCQFRRFTQPKEAGAAYVCETFRAAQPGRCTPKPEGVDVIPAAPPVTGGTDGIPVVILGDGPKDSFVRDVTHDNCAHMNLQSVHDNVLYYGGMQKHLFTGITREELDKWSEAAGVLAGNEDAQVFTISPVYPQGLIEALRSLEVRIHRRGKFQFNQLADDTRQVQSAESKAQDLVVQKDIYDQTLDAFTEAERRIWRFHAIYEAVSPDTIEVGIARDYGFDDKDAERAERDGLWNKARELRVIGVQKQVLKGEVLNLRIVPEEGKTDEEVRAELFAEIDAAQSPVERTSSAINGLGASLFRGVGRGQQETK